LLAGILHSDGPVGVLKLNVYCWENIYFTLTDLMRKGLVGAITLLWVLVSSHCVLESVPGVDLFSCAPDIEHEADPSHGCDEECCPVEFADYQTQREPDRILSTGSFATLSTPALESHDGLIPGPPLGIQSAAPPDFSRTWHFLQRSALPVRAPSLVS
jgi:hypothetical protein